MKKLLILGITLVMTLLLLVSCGDKKDSGDVGKQPGVDVDTVKIENIGEYTLVRGDAASVNIKNISASLKKDLKERLDVDLNMKTDISSVKGNKIVIGKSKYTNVDVDALKEKEFVIKYDNGNIVIVGGGDLGTIAGVEYFMENYISADKKQVFCPSGDGLTYNAYTVDSFKIDGTDISEYKIFAVDQIPEGDEFSKNIRNNYLGVNVSLEIAEEMADGGKYIVLDRSSYDYYDYSLTLENGNLYVNGSFSSFVKAFEELTSFFEGAKGRDVNFTSENNIEGKLDKLEVPYKTKEELLNIYEYAYDNDLTIYGEHLAGTYDVGGFRESFRNEVGDEPAIIDYDLMRHYVGISNRSNISQAICELFEFASRGGIVTTMSHWQNPNPNTRENIYRGTLGTREQWDSLFVEGSTFNTAWKAQLDCDAEFFLALKKLGVCVTFRPIHEANENIEFWFDAVQDGYTLSGDDLREMWNYVYDYYTEELGLDNIVWTYGAMKSRHTDVSQGAPFPTDYYYPGDDRCDLVGLDWYTGDADLTNGYGYERLLEYGKPCGLTEWGTAGNWQNTDSREEQAKLFTCEGLVGILIEARRNDLKIAFWETYWSTFGSALWLEEGEILNETDFIVLLDDMPQIIKKALGK